MRVEQEIKDAINKIRSNKTLSYSYQEDVTYVLDWVLGGEKFDGLEENE